MTDTATEGPVTIVAQARREFINQAALDAAGLRKSMWIMTPDGIAILTGCSADEAVTATLCKDDGRNVMKLDDDDKPVPDSRNYALSDVRVAFVEELPAARIAHSDAAALAALGYVSKESAA